ncbi:dipeptidase [Fuerstiella marisgermanici]|uniref:Membrane dipeptidase (Peptidase family M19) n=1 Tax=Fuerstiella marisgermanici TaxID=1891926 RepID=A0A1P8WA02_9PLAN|nr:membrane dipeptidase [Fuerstiella marisgermanici]APZ90882.1 Membrane dipeptidase (Peptidase family M19) [Fuerstiella marisgermanici]
MDRRTFLQATAATAAIATTSSSSADEPNPVADLTERLNPTIQHAREVALSILKPSPADLQHGLELHADSVVFDSYGFSPRSAIDGDAMKALVEEGGSNAEIKDLREEMSMTRCAIDPVEQAEYHAAWKASGVTCVFQNAGEEGQDPGRLLKRLARFTFVTDAMKDFITKAVVPEDVLDAKRNGRHCLYLTGNGVPLAQEWNTVPEELSYVRIFYQLGIRMMHLTYQRRNMIGDGCGETSNAGLSDFGRAAVAEMNRIGVIPDCAHSGWQTSLEAAKVSSKPVVASHTVAGAIYPHIRSKPDDVLKAIVDSGGFAGICCIPRYLRGAGNIGVLLDHIDYVAKTFGVDHVAIGTDVAYTSQNFAAESKKVPSTGKKRADFRSLWPKDDYVTTQDARNSVAWTNWPLFTVGLVQRGYTDDDIRKIIGGNVLRVAKESVQN